MASKPKIVILNYGPTGVTANPDPVEVVQGDSMVFQKGPNSPPDAKVRVTISEPKFFSRAVYNEGEPPVDVTSALLSLVLYDCDLVVAGQLIPRVKGIAGGGIKPR